jgi:5'(3')-deoxyribonucleotidase
MATLSKPKLCVDIDNVLGQTDKVMREIIRVATVSKENPTGISYDYQDVIHFDYSLNKNAAGLSVSKEIWDAVHQIFQDPKSGYVDLIEPMDGAFDALQILAKQWDIWIVTGRHGGGLSKAKSWIERWFPGFSGNVHSSAGICKHQVADFAAAVDDHFETAVEFANVGVRTFVYSHPWNREAESCPRLTIVHNWAQLVQHLGQFLLKIKK